MKGVYSAKARAEGGPGAGYVDAPPPQPHVVWKPEPRSPEVPRAVWRALPYALKRGIRRGAKARARIRRRQSKYGRPS